MTVRSASFRRKALRVEYMTRAPFDGQADTGPGPVESVFASLRRFPPQGRCDLASCAPRRQSGKVAGAITTKASAMDANPVTRASTGQTHGCDSLLDRVHHI